MIKIGAVNIDTSHPKAFARHLANGSRARYHAVYNDSFRSSDEVQAFISKFSLAERCNMIDDLAEQSDIGFIHSCNWDHHLAQALPFLRLGKPVYIDKPVVGSLRDCIELEEAVKNGAAVFGGSSLRYAPEIRQYLEEDPATRGQTLHIYGTCGTDEFNYGTHIVEAICTLACSPVRAARFSGVTLHNEYTCNRYTLYFESGVTADYIITPGIAQPFVLAVSTTNTTYTMQIDTARIYGALLNEICAQMETGSSLLASVESLTNSVRAMLAAKQSQLSGGNAVDISGIDPAACFDGTAFAEKYSKSAPAAV